MHQNKPNSLVKNIRGHTSLLLASTSSVNNSPLQTNTNNTASFSDDDLPQDNINFKQPQNEIFKKIDGKIQRIVAAHSNMNKLYALNGFSSVGHRKPFELPPQLPRPPPWVPKVSSNNNGTCAIETARSTSINSGAERSIESTSNEIRQISNLLTLNKVTRVTASQDSKEDFLNGFERSSTVSIDSAISKIHQRRQQQQMMQQRLHPLSPRRSQIQKSLLQQPMASRQAHANSNLKQNLSLNDDNVSQDSRVSTSSSYTLNSTEVKPFANQTFRPNLSPEEKRRFQMDLIELFRAEIAAVTKLAKLKFSPSSEDPANIPDQRSLLLKKSPQSIFNTIRRETSLLLNKRESTNRGGMSLLDFSQARSQVNSNENTSYVKGFVNRYHTIKVAVSPSEFHKHTCMTQKSKGASENSICACLESKSELLNVDEWCPSRRFTLRYRNLQAKLIKMKLGTDPIAKRISIDTKRRKSCQRSLDKIVNRLQARCMSSQSGSPNQAPLIHSPQPQDLADVSGSMKAESYSPPSSPKPIPVFRGSPIKGTYSWNTNMSISGSKNDSRRSKKSSRLHRLGLRLENYLEKECPQSTDDKMTIDQFARCLNLVRSNDASLQKYRNKLIQSECQYLSQMGDRPSRLRRIRGDMSQVPASANYKAARRMGLQ